MTANYDVADAHPSPSHAALSEALVDMLHEDTGLLRQRHELATAQGSEGAADAFHRVYHKRIDEWSGHFRAESLQDALVFKPLPSVPDPFNLHVSMRLTTNADDVRVTSITTEPMHTVSWVTKNNAAFQEMALNTAKQEHSVFFAGQRARQYMAFFNGTRVLPGATGPVARYLGPYIDIMDSILRELERRRAAAYRHWSHLPKKCEPDVLSGTRLTRDPEAHQNVLFALFGEAPFESETIFDENGRGRGNGRRMQTVLACSMMERFFREQGGAPWVTGLWTLDFCRHFGQLSPPRKELVEEATERPHICQECESDAQAWIQTTKRHRHSDQHVCMVSEHPLRSSRDLSSSTIVTEGILYGEVESSTHCCRIRQHDMLSL